MIGCCVVYYCWFFFFNDTATTEIYTLSLHDALPISAERAAPRARQRCSAAAASRRRSGRRSGPIAGRSEEHTSELQSRQYLVCRLLLEKKKKKSHGPTIQDLDYLHYKPQRILPYYDD